MHVVAPKWSTVQLCTCEHRLSTRVTNYICARPCYNTSPTFPCSWNVAAWRGVQPVPSFWALMSVDHRTVHLKRSQTALHPVIHNTPAPCSKRLFTILWKPQNDAVGDRWCRQYVNSLENYRGITKITITWSHITTCHFYWRNRNCLNGPTHLTYLEDFTSCIFPLPLNLLLCYLSPMYSWLCLSVPAPPCTLTFSSKNWSTNWRDKRHKAYTSRRTYITGLWLQHR